MLIKLRRFMSVDSRDLEIDDVGMLLIVGANGSSKSTNLEAISHCLFNRSLRHPSGKPMGWRVDEAGGVRVEWGDKWVERRVSKAGNQSLKSWLEDEVSFPTTTKHQAAIEEHIGKFEDWRRASFMTSKDGSRFTLATDKARKEILENAIGLDKLAQALKQVRSDLKTARAEKQLKAYAAKAEQDKVKLIQKGLEASCPEKPQELDLDVLRAEATQVAQAKKRLTQSLSEASERRTQATLLVRDLEAKLREKSREIAEQEAGVCDSCGAKLQSEKDVGQLEDQKATLQEELEKAQEALKFLPDAGNLTKELAQATEKLSAINHKAVTYKAAVAQWEEAQSLSQDRQKDLEDQERLATEAFQADQDAATELEVLENCEKVLAPKGVRAKLLGQAVDSLNALLRTYVAQMCGPNISVVVSLKSDAVALDVQGYSKVGSYISLSDGQRSRVDLALGMAISALCRGRNQTGLPNLLLLDEAFGGLDTEGVESAVQLVKEMSENTSVVLVSHNSELINSFSGRVLRC